MKRTLVIIPIVLVLAIALVISFRLMTLKPDTSHINPAQKLAQYSKPAVVRIFDYAVVEVDANPNSDPILLNILREKNYQLIVGGAGSGFTINPNGYIVTNAHVVQTNKLTEQEIANLALDNLAQEIATGYNFDPAGVKQYLLENTAWVAVKKYLQVYLPDGSHFDGEVKSYGAPVGEGKDVAVVKIEGKNLPALSLGDSDKVQLQSNVMVFGYPAAADSSVLSPDSQLVVSITNGKVSATDKKSAQGSPIIQIDAAATHGNSGGPVLAEDGTVIGILTFRGDTVMGQEVQGFNFVVPVNTLKEFVSQAGAKNELGEVDKLYREGLDFYWGGYYNDALEKFEEVQRLYSNHSEVKKLITECQQKSHESKKILWSKYRMAFLAFDVADIILIIGLLIATFSLKKKEDLVEKDLNL